MSDLLRLYGYWRSSAAFRVRIALALKGLKYENYPVHLLQDGGEQHLAAFKNVNPQQLIPVLVDGERVFRQSMAIIEYLDEQYPDNGARLLPVGPRERARVRALAQMVACDIHPLPNLRVVQYLEREFGTPQVERDRWTRHWIENGFTAIEELLASNPSTGEFCEGDAPTMADCLLIPQTYNALRFGVPMTKFPTIQRIYQTAMARPEFTTAAPEQQPDAPRV
jgi:maleylacetoacetate isomerase